MRTAETARSLADITGRRAALVAYDHARQDYINDHPHQWEASDDAALIEQAGDALGDAVAAIIKAFGGKAEDYLWGVCDLVENGDFLKKCAELRLATPAQADERRAA